MSVLCLAKCCFSQIVDHPSSGESKCLPDVYISQLRCLCHGTGPNWIPLVDVGRFSPQPKAVVTLEL